MFAQTRLGIARQHKRKSAGQVAAELRIRGLNTTEARLRHIEAGRTEPTREEKQVIAEILEVKPWEVFES